MAIAKVILNGETQMDVTQKTVTAGSMLSGTTALKNDGTDITGSIESKTSSDLTASGATVTAPAGFYASAASKSVASGSAGTPTASKGTVSNHSISVTPSVTNTTGYITGGTKTGTAVTVSASELVSGTKTISASGTTDVTNYESVSVASGSAKTPATTITANPTVSVNSSGLITATVSKTQSVTPTVSAGYVSSGTAGTVTVSGSGTTQLTTQVAQTIHPSTTDQTIASGTYLTGRQTINAVRTANLYAGYIVNGVTVKIGDAYDDDCVASVTGKAHTSGYVATITRTGNRASCRVTYDGVDYPYGSINTFLFSSGDVLQITSVSNIGNAEIYIDGVRVATSGQDTSVTYDYTLPANCINILTEEGNFSKVYVTTPTLSITENGTYNVGDYGKAEVNVPGGGRYVVTISGTGDADFCFVKHNDTKYYTNGDTFTYAIGDTLTCWVDYGTSNKLYVDDIVVAGGYGQSVTNYSYTLPVGGIGIELVNSRGASYIKITTNEPTISITSNGTYDVYEYSKAEVNVSSSGGLSDEDLKAVVERSVTSLTLPDNLTKIGDYAFAGCTSLATMNIPSDITSIGTYAFYKCSALSMSQIPSGVTSIGPYAYYYCSGLTATSIPSGLTQIADYAFYNCDNIVITSLPSGITSIGTSAFFSCLHVAITEIPSGVKTIRDYAFNGCLDITTISSSATITSMGNGCFVNNMGDNASYVMKLAHASFPNMALSYMSTCFGSTYAERACKLLEDIDIGNTSSISSYAFQNCYKLQTLILRKSDAICTLSNVNAFTNTPMRGYNSLSGTIYVPSALISTYQTATNWSTIYGEGHVTFAAIEGSQYEL